MNKKFALQILLLLVGISHLALGLLANLAPPDMLAKAVAATYGASIELSPQVHHVIRMLGAFMIGIGGLALVAAREPRHHRAIIIGISAILILRVIQRIMVMDEVSTAFAISSGRIWMQAVFFLALAVGLLVLMPKSSTTTAHH